MKQQTYMDEFKDEIIRSIADTERKMQRVIKFRGKRASVFVKMLIKSWNKTKAAG